MVLINDIISLDLIFTGLNSLAICLTAILATITLKETFKAHIIIQVTQQNNKLYLYIKNIGMRDAFGIKINSNINNFLLPQNHENIPPTVSYRYELIEPKYMKIDGDPNILVINISYSNYFGIFKSKNYVFKFDLRNILKYNSVWNEEYGCYDIFEL